MTQQGNFPDRRSMAVHHAYLEEGDKLPCSRDWILAVDPLQEGPVLHVWWYGLEEEEKSQP